MDIDKEIKLEELKIERLKCEIRLKELNSIAQPVYIPYTPVEQPVYPNLPWWNPLGPLYVWSTDGVITNSVPASGNHTFTIKMPLN